MDYKTLNRIWSQEFTNGDSLIIKSGISYTPNTSNKLNDVRQENSKRLNEMGSALNQSLEENRLLKAKMDSIDQSSQLNRSVYLELKALYPEISEAYIQTGNLFNGSDASQRMVYLVSLTLENNLNASDLLKIKAWLLQRLNTSEVKLITQTQGKN